MGITRIIPIVFSIILLGALGSFQDVEAGRAGGVDWTTPGDISVEQNTVGGADVVYSVTASPVGRPGDILFPDCGAFSTTGDFFPLGTTTVTCSVDDPEGRDPHFTSFDVTVEPAMPLFKGVFWSGDGDGMSWNDPDNWRDTATFIHRLPECDDEILVTDADVMLNIDFTICGGHLDLLESSVQIKSENTLTNEDDAESIFVGCDSTLEVLGFLINAGFIIVDCDTGELLNNGVITNTDTGFIGIFFGELNNSEDGIINNDGTIINEAVLSIHNLGTINIGVDGFISNVSGHIDNFVNALILNEGVIDNGGFTIDNEGTIINQCTGVITGEAPNDIDDGITFNRSCNGPLYSIDKSNPPVLREIDPTNAQTISEVDISIDGFDPDDIKGGSGLATNPLSGELFALLKLDSDDDEGTPKSRTLVTLIPETGIATMLGIPGNTGDAFAGIAFDSTGNLFGVTGDGADVDETFFSLSIIDGSATLLCELGNGSDGEALAHNPANGILYHGSGDDVFETIDSTTDEDCDVTDIGLEDDLEGEFTALTFGEAEDLFFAANFDELLTISPNPGEVISVGFMDEDSKGLAFAPLSDDIITVLPIPTGGSGSITIQDPNLGDIGTGEGHDNGFCMNQNCINVDGFFNHFPEKTVAQGSTEAFTILVNCPRGENTCNHIEIAGTLPDADFYDYRWAATVDRQQGTDNWGLTTTNPFEEIGEVSVTVQPIGNSFVSATFNIPFLISGSVGTPDGIGDPQVNNRHLHVTVWDNIGGLSNYIFNDGVYVEDIYAYPQADVSFDAPLEYEELCLNENANKRYTCAFDKVKDWTIKNAEEKLKEIYDEKNYKNNLE